MFLESLKNSFNYWLYVRYGWTNSQFMDDEFIKKVFDITKDSERSVGDHVQNLMNEWGDYKKELYEFKFDEEQKIRYITYCIEVENRWLYCYHGNKKILVDIKKGDTIITSIYSRVSNLNNEKFIAKNILKEWSLEKLDTYKGIFTVI